MSIKLSEPEILPCLAQGFMQTDTTEMLSEADLESFVSGAVPEENFISLEIYPRRFNASTFRDLLKSLDECPVDVEIAAVLKGEGDWVQKPLFFLFRVLGGAEGLSSFILWYFGLPTMSRAELSKSVIMKSLVHTPLFSLRNQLGDKSNTWITCEEATKLEEEQEERLSAMNDFFEDLLNTPEGLFD